MEHEEVRRLPEEVVETYRRPLVGAARARADAGGAAAGGPLPGEVVEIYRQPLPGEVVEQYARQLPLMLSMRLMDEEVRDLEPPPRRRRSRRGLWTFLILFALTAALGVGNALWNRWPPAEERHPSDHFVYDFGFGFAAPEEEEERPGAITIPSWPTGQGALLALEGAQGAEPLTAQEIYRLVNPAVVVVLADLGDGTASVGTGVIFREDGYVLTNHHVVEGGQACTVALDSGRGYEARYVAGDADSDLAVLKVEGQGLPAAAFGDSDQLTVGDRVYAIGNPLGVDLRGTLTDGIVSAIDRDVPVDGRTMTLLQTNAALNSGNSGGPLINQYGQVVGINTIKMTSRYSNIEGLGFAIPTSYLERVVNDLLTYGALQPEPVLGITVSQVSDEVEAGLWGIQVQSVRESSPADRAGVEEGDYILSAGGQGIDSSQALLRARRQCHLGDELSLTLWRDGETLEVTLHLTEPVT